MQGGVVGARVWVGAAHAQQEGLRIELPDWSAIVNTEVAHFGVCNQINDCVSIIAGGGTTLQDFIFRGNFALQTVWNAVVFRGGAPNLAGTVAFIWQVSRGTSGRSKAAINHDEGGQACGRWLSVTQWVATGRPQWLSHDPRWPLCRRRTPSSSPTRSC